MPVQKPRKRIVIFRLTDDEYEELKAARVTRGARNMSDFARTELLKSAASDPLEVTRKLAQIESGVQRLEKMIVALALAEGKKELPR